MGSRGPGALSGALSSVVRRLPGASAASLLSSDTVNTFLKRTLLISYLFVCLLTVCCWNKIHSTFKGPASVKKSGSLLRHRAGDQARPRGPEDGTLQELTEAALLAWALGLS